VAVRAYPDLVNKEQDWISRQLVSVNLQQADRDFNIAEWYRRTGHPGAAYFYYELVMRRYPNTSYAEKAAGHQKEVQAKAAHEQAVAAAKANTPQSPGMFSWLSPTPSSAQANIGTPTATPTSLPQSLNKN
jgi:outer membrane protein assembly factor BamD (BamD/ComL family)